MVNSVIVICKKRDFIIVFCINYFIVCNQRIF